MSWRPWTPSQKADKPIFVTERLTDPDKIADFLARAKSKGYLPDASLGGSDAPASRPQSPGRRWPPPSYEHAFSRRPPATSTGLETALSTVGGAVAGTLWWAHRASVELPCTGDGRGCDLVNASRWAHVTLGPWHDIPLALLGFLSYLALLTLAMMKLGADTEQARRLLHVPFWLHQPAAGPATRSIYSTSPTSSSARSASGASRRPPSMTLLFDDGHRRSYSTPPPIARPWLLPQLCFRDEAHHPCLETIKKTVLDGDLAGPPRWRVLRHQQTEQRRRAAAAAEVQWRYPC